MPQLKEAKLKRFQLAQTAISLFESSSKLPTVSDICIPNDLDVLSFYDYFPTREACIRYYFSSIPERYALMISEIEEFEILAPGEKMANFVLSSIDMLDEFPKATSIYFDHSSGLHSDFFKNAQHVIADILENDSHIPSLNLMVLSGTFFYPVALSYQQIVRYAVLSDDENRQTTFALTEKISSLFNEIITNASLSKGIDLIKFISQSNIISLSFRDK